MSNGNNAMIPANLGAIAISRDGMQMASVAEVFAFSDMMCKAGWLPKGVTKEGAVIAILAGMPLGLNAFQAVQGIAPINGRPAIWGDAMVAVVRGSGLLEDEQVEYLPNAKDCQGVKVTVKRKGIATPTEGFFSKTMAEKAGLWGKTGPWSQYPVRMMMNRARAFAYRDAFADVLKGIKCAEEEQDIVTVEAAPAPVKRKRAAAATLIAQEEVVEVPVEEGTLGAAPAAVSRGHEIEGHETAPVEVPIVGGTEAVMESIPDLV